MTKGLPETCNACAGDCLDACFNDAIAAVSGGVVIWQDRCAGCGSCLSACNLGHIRLEHGVAHLFPSRCAEG